MAFLLKKLSFFQPPFPRGVAVEIFWIWDQDSCWGKRVSAKKEANQPRDNEEKGHCSFLLPSPLLSSLRSQIFSIQLVTFLPHQGSSDLPTSDKGRSGDPQKKKDWEILLKGVTLFPCGKLTVSLNITLF